MGGIFTQNASEWRSNMTLSEQEFGRIVSYIKARTGIELGQKRVLIAGRLENYLIKNGYNSYT